MLLYSIGFNIVVELYYIFLFIFIFYIALLYELIIRLSYIAIDI